MSYPHYGISHHHVRASAHPTKASWGELLCQEAEEQKILLRRSALYNSAFDRRYLPHYIISTPTTTTKGGQPECERLISEHFVMRTTTASETLFFFSQNGPSET